MAEQTFKVRAKSEVVALWCIRYKNWGNFACRSKNHDLESCSKSAKDMPRVPLKIVTEELDYKVGHY